MDFYNSPEFKKWKRKRRLQDIGEWLLVTAIIVATCAVLALAMAALGVLLR